MMDMIEQHIITLTMGLGGWFGVLYAIGAQMINGGELNAGAVATMPRFHLYLLQVLCL